MRKTLFYIFGPIALAGFLLSTITHIAALSGRPGPLGDSAMILHVGTFVVWVPAMITARAVSKRTKRGEAHKAVFRGAPPWVRYSTFVLFAYGIVNVVMFIRDLERNADSEPSAKFVAETRGASGHWMFFYGAGLAILYSAANIADPQK